MIREICRMGNPILRRLAEPVALSELQTPEFQSLIQDLRDSMKHYGGIGIAAPQIGVALQVAVIELPPVSRYGEQFELPFTLFINPVMDYLTDEQQGYWEGCLSVPGLRGFVERPKKIRVTYWDQEGSIQVLAAEGFLATVLQHELDHLRGVLYIDRIKHPSLLAFQEEYDKFILPEQSK
jgi:peptide deformylase